MRRGAVHLVCRNKDRAEEAKAEIAKESGNNDIFVHILDMSEAKKVWEFAEGLRKDHKSLNVLHQQVVMTEQWGKMHSSIHFSAVHPGWADTPAAMPDFQD